LKRRGAHGDGLANKVFAFWKKNPKNQRVNSKQRDMKRRIRGRMVSGS